MSKNKSIKKMVKNIKENKRFPYVVQNGMRTDIYYNEKDMRQAAMEDNAHGAREYWGNKDGKGNK